MTFDDSQLPVAEGKKESRKRKKKMACAHTTKGREVGPSQQPPCVGEIGEV